jgi:ribulose-phosphate 3-epimerase
MRQEEELKAVETADAVHVDVMDNHFVPNLTLGLPVVEGVQRVSPIPLDVHLMIEDADRWAPAYAELGAASVTFHAEAAAAPIRLARTIRSLGSKAAVALRPATPVQPWLDLLPEIDMLLLMTVEPGFGGQSFLEVTLPKIRAARSAIDAAGGRVALQLDGGINLDTIRMAADAGADTFVAGSAVYGADDVAGAIAALRAAATN